MSASKLEKNVANLERRLRHEFQLELNAKLEPCLCLFQPRSAQECREWRIAERLGPSEGSGWGLLLCMSKLECRAFTLGKLLDSQQSRKGVRSVHMFLM